MSYSIPPKKLGYSNIQHGQSTPAKVTATNISTSAGFPGQTFKTPMPSSSEQAKMKKDAFREACRHYCNQTIPSPVSAPPYLGDLTGNLSEKKPISPLVDNTLTMN